MFNKTNNGLGKAEVRRVPQSLEIGKHSPSPQKNLSDLVFLIGVGEGGGGLMVVKQYTEKYPIFSISPNL